MPTDTYAIKNNDVDSPLKSFAATLGVPKELEPDKPFAVTGYAQAGISGLKKVQVVGTSGGRGVGTGRDKHFARAPWIDAEVLPPPAAWGGWAA